MKIAPSHISELEEQFQAAVTSTQNIRAIHRSASGRHSITNHQQTGYMFLVHPEHGSLKVDVQTGIISEHK